MLKLFLAAMLAAITVPAQALVGLVIVSDLHYERSDVWGGHEEDDFIGSMTFTAPTWDSLFYSEGVGPFFGCRVVKTPCITATRTGNQLRFTGSNMTGYDSLYVSLYFDRDLESDPFAMNGAKLISGAFSWGAGGHSVTSSITGPVKYVYGVPEPATWAMMIAGFGLLGGALRRQQRATIAFA